MGVSGEAGYKNCTRVLLPGSMNSALSPPLSFSSNEKQKFSESLSTFSTVSLNFLSLNICILVTIIFTALFVFTIH